MQYSDLVQSSWKSLLRTRGRSVLTMLGIVIGIAAVILALSIGESAQRFILSQISVFGPDKLIVHPGSKSMSELQSATPFVDQTLEFKDIKRLRKEPWIDMLSAEVMQTDLIKAGDVNKSITVIGTFPDEIRIGGYSMAAGEFISDADVDSHAKVAVLGSAIADEIFGQEEAVGKRIKLGTTSYRVIGVVKEAGTQFFTNLDELVYLPGTTLLDVYHKKFFEYFIVKTQLPLPEAMSRLEIIMREAHNIDNPTGDLTKDDFFVMTAEDAVKMVEQITSVLQILLTAIAAISLVVGGIGIMNIMFVSVTERIAEIGLRKSIGAKYKDILRQFLMEAVILTMAGGAIGFLTGSFLAWLAIQIINHYQPGWTYLISWNGALLGFSVSTIIGVVFGYLPARKAAKLHPIEALRHE
ncbi:MAG: ABC transporter permease [Patescibacteria group bacterium]|nr:ABC transporter permease [Patescibacteria group bacterium]